MPKVSRLATLAQLKSRLGTSETSDDAQMLELIEASTSIAVDELVGAEVRREVGVTLHPSVSSPSRKLWLPRFPIESIDSVQQSYAVPAGNDWSAVDELVEFTDYLVCEPGAGDPKNRGALERINAIWHVGTHLIRVVGVFGFADPARIRVPLTAATWTEATKTLTQAGAFAGYTFAAGDVIAIEGGTGATPGAYLVASRTSDDAVVLAESLSAAGTDLSVGDITSASGGIDPPKDLQEGIIADTLQRWAYRNTGGVGEIQLPNGGAYRSKGLKPHEALVAACRPLRRYTA